VREILLRGGGDFEDVWAQNLGGVGISLEKGPVTSVLSVRGRCGTAVVRSERDSTWGREGILKRFGPKFWARNEYRRNWLLHLQRMPRNRIPLKS